jgi:hypothetical protein
MEIVGPWSLLLLSVVVVVVVTVIVVTVVVAVCCGCSCLFVVAAHCRHHPHGGCGHCHWWGVVIVSMVVMTKI